MYQDVYFSDSRKLTKVQTHAIENLYRASMKDEGDCDEGFLDKTVDI